MEKDYILKWLEENLSKERYFHTLGSAKCAKELAQKYELNEEKAELAGLLHDSAKCFSKEELLKVIREKIPNITEDLLLNYKTYHAPVGAYIAKTKFEIEDEEILNAIKCHTLGKLGMTVFEMIIFLADKIEENTRDPKHRKKILKILNKNEGIYGLKKAVFICFAETIKSLVKRKLPICMVTIDVYNELLAEISSKD